MQDYKVFFQIASEQHSARVENVIVSMPDSNEESHQLYQCDQQSLSDNLFMTEGLKQLALTRKIGLQDSVSFLKIQPYDWRQEYLA